MKFGQKFKEALEKDGYPLEWVDTAIPYRQLKKLIKKTQQELEILGFDSNTLAQLKESSADEGAPSGEGVAFQYSFEGNDNFVPKLSFVINVNDGIPQDAQLSPETRRLFEALALGQPGSLKVSSFGNDGQSENLAVEVSTVAGQSGNLRRIDVHLRFDAEFFGLLHLKSSEAWEAREAHAQEILTNEIQELSKTVAVVARPNPATLHKSDLNRWRELFDVYLEAAVFFSTNEIDHGSRSSVRAAEQLQWFQSEVVKRDIMSKFKVKNSHAALKQFVKINIDILELMKFQELNNTGRYKIMKKFDKKTGLGAARTFPELIPAGSVVGDTMARAVCAQISQEVVQLVPRLEDHACPVCTDIAWRPVRLQCKHLICIQCAITMQKGRKRFCPLCREDVVMIADTDSIDRDLEAYLRKWFPKETLNKQIDNETIDGIMKFGPYYRHPSEHNCAIM
ncbi:uncharacterized protein RSE6_02321 [Rhynchosporium secalis]|uniref:RING-14 protein n=1 Tax=Rhynchosporium secalis TaxID=38038 RepID=A0A1E1LZY2_RHYSE|nr:uncharacterized protein RSE6_02321 [Rhynchosporium secalis]